MIVCIDLEPTDGCAMKSTAKVMTTPNMIKKDVGIASIDPHRVQSTFKNFSSRVHL